MTLLLENLSVTTPKSKLLIKALNIEIKRGEVWAILGPNGCGKSTLLHVLAGIKPNQSGTITIDGVNLSKMTPKKRAQKLALLVQEPDAHIEHSVAQYCVQARYPHTHYFKLTLDTDQTILENNLRAMDLVHLRHQKIKHLSGGEKKRVYIASVFCQTPDYLFLDEPTNHLDLHYQIKTLKLLRKKTKLENNAVMMALHDVNLAQAYCDAALLLFKGGDYLAGSITEILTASNLKKLYNCNAKAILNGNEKFWQFGL